MVPYRAPFRCNWLQVLDAILDPIHTSFLHSSISREQFSPGFGEIGRIDFRTRHVLRGRTPAGWAGTSGSGSTSWCCRTSPRPGPRSRRRHEAALLRAHGVVRWVVPVDDENTTALAWACFGERGDPLAMNTPEGPELIEQGEVFDRPYEQRQRFPGDAEAVEGMGRTVHAEEHLAPSDKGIALMRRRLRERSGRWRRATSG